MLAARAVGTHHLRRMSDLPLAVAPGPHVCAEHERVRRGGTGPGASGRRARAPDDAAEAQV
jgi:hypothetical protein